MREDDAKANLSRGLVVRMDGQRQLHIHGDDAAIWLQGMVTQNVVEMAEGDVRHAFVLGRTGKILAGLWLHRVADGFDATLRADVLDPIVAHLDAHLIMEDVELEASDAVVLHAMPADGGAALAGIITPRLTDRGVDVVLPADEVDAWIEASGLERQTEAQLDALAIALGRPQAGLALVHDHLPQETGLKALSVSFEKGCYVGQEPVVMLEHRGQAPKRLCRLELPAPIAEGTALTIEGTETKAGVIVRVAGEMPPTSALGWVKRKALEADSPLAADGIPVRLAGPVEF